MLAIPAFAVLPRLVIRTNVGYVDTDAFILLLFLAAIYLYARSFCPSIRQHVLYKLASVLALGVLGLMWPGVGIVAGVLFGCDFFILISRSEPEGRAPESSKHTHWRSLIISLVGALLYIGCIFVAFGVSRARENVSNPFALFAIAPALLAWYGNLIALLRNAPWRYRSSRLLIAGILTFTALAGLILVISKGRFIETLLIRILYPFGTDPIMLRIAELQPFGAKEWWRTYGIFLPFGLFGLGGLIYENWQTAMEKLSKPRLHLVGLVLGMLVMILSRAFTSFFVHPHLATGTLFLIGSTIWMILHVTYITMKVDRPCSLVVVLWFLVTFNLACFALRFNLLFAPVLILLAGVCIVKMLQRLLPKVQGSVGFYVLLSLCFTSWQLLLTDSNILTFPLRVLFNWIVHPSPRTELGVTIIQ